MHPTPETVQRLHRSLLAHFDDAQRDLPWRTDRTPYRTWVAEVMLQQTRVATVIPYYEAWMRDFPDVASLADAEESAVLKRWEGLGYYSRARNLHRAARVVRDELGGVFPDTVAGLRRLPGIGEYTAGAIASLVYGERVPAVDGNVRRVLARLFDVPDPSARELREAAGRLVPEHAPGTWNEALMELGATVCTPRRPMCEVCPFAPDCAARAAGTVLERPVARKRGAMRSASFDVLVAVREDGAVYLARRPEDGLLGGLWHFPERERVEGVSADPRNWDLDPVAGIDTLPPVPHVFSHLKARYEPRLIRARGGRTGADAGWFAPEDASALALPVAQRKILDAALERLSEGPE